MGQSIKNKLGEIEFRKKIVEQQTKDKTYFDDEYNKEDIENIILERMDTTYAKIKKLAERNITISPYLEIGAERGQRSLVMENDLEASGAAVDLSFDMLKSCAYYSVKFGKKKLPLRICTDAYSLPFKSNSVPFVFCYQTLHHFPDPTPIIKEIHRVLSPGGTFFFDEEPYKKVLHVDLYKRRHKMYSTEARNKRTFMKIIDHFFAEENCNETDHGVLENDKIPLRIWKNALNFFFEKNVQLKYAKNFNINLFGHRTLIKLFAAYLFGGHISGDCRKAGKLKNYPNISDSLICPSCILDNIEINLEYNEGFYSCSRCQRKYPETEGVAFLFKDELFNKLYPEQITGNFG